MHAHTHTHLFFFIFVHTHTKVKASIRPLTVGAQEKKEKGINNRNTLRVIFEFPFDRLDTKGGYFIGSLALTASV